MIDNKLWHGELEPYSSTFKETGSVAGRSKFKSRLSGRLIPDSCQSNLDDFSSPMKLSPNCEQAVRHPLSHKNSSIIIHRSINYGSYLVNRVTLLLYRRSILALPWAKRSLVLARTTGWIFSTLQVLHPPFLTAPLTSQLLNPAAFPSVQINRHPVYLIQFTSVLIFVAVGDPFCIVKTFGANIRKVVTVKTRPQPASAHPVWNHESILYLHVCWGIYQLTGRDISGAEVLNVGVWQKMLVGKEFVGNTIVQLPPKFGRTESLTKDYAILTQNQVQKGVLKLAIRYPTDKVGISLVAMFVFTGRNWRVTSIESITKLRPPKSNDYLVLLTTMSKVGKHLSCEFPLISDFSCSMEKRGLLRSGRLFVTHNWLLFHSSLGVKVYSVLFFEFPHIRFTSPWWKCSNLKWKASEKSYLPIFWVLWQLKKRYFEFLPLSDGSHR